MNEHPDQAQLIDFLTEKLTPEESTACAEHVGACSFCQKRLRSLVKLIEDFEGSWEKAWDLLAAAGQGEAQELGPAALRFKMQLETAPEGGLRLRGYRVLTPTDSKLSISPPEGLRAVAGPESSSARQLRFAILAAGKELGAIYWDAERKAVTVVLEPSELQPLSGEVLLLSESTGKHYKGEVQEVEGSPYLLFELESLDPGTYVIELYKKTE